MTPRTRTVSRIGVTTVTGVTTVAALAGTGWLTGQAAADLHAEQAQRQAEQDAATSALPQSGRRDFPGLGPRARPAGQGQTVLRQRPTRTDIVYRYLPSTAVGSGGSVTTVQPVAPAQQPASAPQQAAPAPPPAPPTQSTPTTPTTPSTGS